MSQRVLVAMSGGVDSSVAAALLVERGYEVVGVSMDLVRCERAGDRSCCSARDRMDARAVAEALGIRHRVIDGTQLFRSAVIDPFVDEYLAGRTPSPCIRCNQFVKFPELLRLAEELGAARIATGHYARVDGVEGRFRLLRGLDPKKDQSYFLFALSQRELARCLFPLGGMTKAEVRAAAARHALATREKPESQEICFVPEEDYARFVEERAGARLCGPGEFVDGEGRTIGRHAGIHAYTVGQRRGLGFGTGRRRYVTAIDAARNRVVLGGEEALFRTELAVCGASWVDASLAGEREALVKIRSTHAGTRAVLAPEEGGRVRVRFAEPVRAPAPGQAAVFYDGDEVLGGGWIA